MANEKVFRKIEFIKRSEFDPSKFAKIEPTAQKFIEDIKDDNEVFAIRFRMNSPKTLEAASKIDRKELSKLSDIMED